MRINETLIQRTFENEFNEVHYKELVLNLFNHFDFSKEHTLKHQFNDAERQALNDFTYFGTYEDAEKKCLDVLTVELKSSSKVERARSLQRNLIGKYLKTNLKDSALVAFYSKDNPDWRLSFVKMDYRLDKGGVKVEIGTPPKRYSFLVGKTEPSHTAQKQLMPLLDDRKTPTFDEIEKSFSIEKVTKEFYTEIAKKFTELVGGERKIGSKKMVEKGCLRLPSTDDDTVKKEFAVRLIGRLLFCWFLKKKKSEKGKQLLTSVLISSDAVRQEQNYYHRFLEPLFFQVLNTPQGSRDDCFKKDFWNKIPFLNGGLFEPHQYDFYMPTEPFGHSRHINTLKIPDEWFLDLFKIFEIYNFTIDESTSIDIDISVDPEMLGRIFENLLAEINPETGETARKSTGSYYTPRPIVEYMVDESLKQYLKTQIGNAPQPPLKLRGGEGGVMFPSPLEGEGKGEGESLDDKLSRLLSYGDWEIDLTETEKDSIIDALDRARIIDPACGSGAFPMGILHKMLLILQKIDPESKQWLSKKLARIDNEILRKEAEKKLRTENWDYVHKLGIIQNSVYGVDIQPIAVEISKLRFFLSLIVDEKIDDNKPNRGVVPLPNLEFKFVAANSLIGLPKAEGGLAESHKDIEKLKGLRDAYFTSYGDEKRNIEEQFKETQRRMFLHALNWQATSSQTYKLSEWNPFSDEASSWFDPEWMFGVKDGFDCVIANPPYLRIQEIQKNNPDLAEQLKKNYFSASGSFDIYACFVELAIKLMNGSGNIAYILPHKFFQAAFGKNLRQLISSKRLLRHIVDFGSSQVFEAATTYTCLLFLSPCNDKFKFAELKPDVQARELSTVFDLVSRVDIKQDNKVEIALISNDTVTEKEWHFSAGKANDILSKLRKQTRTLADVCEKIFQGIATSADKIYFLKHISEKDGIVTAFSESLNKEITIESDFVKPLLKGADVHRYSKLEPKIWCIFPYRVKNNKAVLFTQDEIKKRFPRTWTYLLENKRDLENRENGRMAHDEFYAYIYPKNLTEFEKPKIITPEISYGCNMTFDSAGLYHNTKCYSFVFKRHIKESPLFFLALLNSKLLWYFLTSTGYVLRGGYFVFKTNYLLPFPLPKELSLEEHTSFVRLVDYIMYLNRQPELQNANLHHSRDKLMVSYFEQIIDAMVYELYFPEDFHLASKHYIRLMMQENLPDISKIQGDSLEAIRAVFERLYDKEHQLRKNIFFLDSLEVVRIIEGKNENK